MYNLKFRFVLIDICVLCTTITYGQEDIIQQIDGFVEDVLSCGNVPGLSLTVIKDGQDFLSKGYGVANIETREPVTNETLFNINSLTKAFAGVASAIAIKHDGSYGWNTPVRNILGDWFYLNDSTRTQQITLVDVLSHRVGLPANDPIILFGYDLRELTEKLQYLEYITDFRHAFAYNNLMFSLPMLVIEQTKGQKWMDYVKQNIFQPLGMSSTGFLLDTDRLPEMAQGYHLESETGELRLVNINASISYYETVPAAGGIITNAIDMRQWIKFQLNQGMTEEGNEILTQQEFQETHRKHNHEQGERSIRRPYYPVTYAPPSGYSFGWRETSYRDYLLHHHGGRLNAFNSLLMILPDVKHGVFLSVNRRGSTNANSYMGMFILDLLLGEDPWLNKDTVCELLQPKIEKQIPKVTRDTYRSKQPKEQLTFIKDKSTNSELKKLSCHKNKESITLAKKKELPDFIGTYGHYAYGNLTIAEGPDSRYVMIYGYDDWTYDLEPSQNEENLFNAVGREPFWYHNYILLFDKNPGEVATALTVTFDLEIPPRFERYLDWDNLPLHPELC